MLFSVFYRFRIVLFIFAGNNTDIEGERYIFTNKSAD